MSGLHTFCPLVMEILFVNIAFILNSKLPKLINNNQLCFPVIAFQLIFKHHDKAEIDKGSRSSIIQI